MGKTMLFLSLAGLAGLVSAGDALGQFRVNFGGRNSPSISVGGGPGGYYAPNGYYGGQGYNPFYQNYRSNYGRAYQFAPGYYDQSPRYYADPAYYYSQPQIRQSYYPAPTALKQAAQITVLVPTANAQVWFDDSPTSQQGMERLYHSPALEPNQTFTYTIKARWMENGQAVTRARRANVQGGEHVTVNFR